MSKPRDFFYYIVIPGEMELLFKGVSDDAELIVHRLMRVYFSRKNEIPATVSKISSLVNLSQDRVQDAWEDLAEIIDIAGSVVRIPWFDEQVEKANQRSLQAAKNARKRWGNGQ